MMTRLYVLRAHVNNQLEILSDEDQAIMIAEAWPLRYLVFCMDVTTEGEVNG